MLPTFPTVLLYLIIFLYGIIIGSFLNVCILRIPNKENIAKGRSHCMTCGYQLKWYDLVPLFSYLFLGGRCRKCRQRISVQYPIIEALNGILYILVFAVYGASVDTLLYCLMLSGLLVLGVIDIRKFQIPWGMVIFIQVLGLVRVMTDLLEWRNYVSGCLIGGGFLFLYFMMKRNKSTSWRVISLAAACGLAAGFKLTLIGLATAAVIGAVWGFCQIIVKMEKKGEAAEKPWNEVLLKNRVYVPLGACLSAAFALAVLCAHMLLEGNLF